MCIGYLSYSTGGFGQLIRKVPLTAYEQLVACHGQNDFICSIIITRIACMAICSNKLNRSTLNWKTLKFFDASSLNEFQA